MSFAPGVMIYYDIIPALSYLSLPEKGLLLDAILTYGSTGDSAEYDDALGAVWALIRPKIDRDQAAYQKKCEQARRAAEARAAKRNASVGTQTAAPVTDLSPTTT